MASPLPVPPELLLVEASAMNTARQALISAGVAAPSRTLCLGRMVLPFGKYVNASFHWLAENDVGYLVYLMDKHTEESKGRCSKQMSNGWLKDLLLEYARSFPQISNMLAENVDRCIYGQKGFEDRTFGKMFELYRRYAVLKANPSHFTEEEAKRVRQPMHLCVGGSTVPSHKSPVYK